jgi:hypothetical protein
VILEPHTVRSPGKPVPIAAIATEREEYDGMVDLNNGTCRQHGLGCA